MPKLLSFPRGFTAALTLICLPLASLAADSPSSAPATTVSRAVDLDAVRSRIAVKDWTSALAELRRLEARQSADWNNLMGYALRNAPQADWAASSRYYDQALHIDPQHRGALAYSGELALQRGDFSTAEQRFEALERACGQQACPELTSLGQAMEQYTARPK